MRRHALIEKCRGEQSVAIVYEIRIKNFVFLKLKHKYFFFGFFSVGTLAAAQHGKVLKHLRSIVKKKKKKINVFANVIFF